MVSRKVEFQNASGERLSGVLDIPEAGASAWAIFAHCFTCSKISLAASRISRALTRYGIGVLRFDFTGLGESDGDFSETGFSSNVEDLISAAAWMRAQARGVQLLVGHSLGGAAVIVAAQHLDEVMAVATLGAPADADHVIAQFDQHIPEITAKGEASVNLAGRPFVLRKSFLADVKAAKVREAAAALKRPLLIMHSPVDEVVGIDNATDLFVAARHPKSFVSLDGASHLLTRSEDSDFVADIVANWARRYLDLNQPTDDRPVQTHDVIVRETGDAGPYQNEVFVVGRR
ncbi:MAG: alpha/beta hydrolase, partial [Henriciella sp.]|nr:alpha/beta hydrolase [Henriciella sp.]